MAKVGDMVQVEQISMVVLYDPDTGDIAHIHQCVSVRKGKHPTKKALEAEAQQQASGGGSKKKLSLLHVNPRKLNVDTLYRVDVEKRSLVAIPNQPT